jgi:hypothetical protein
MAVVAPGPILASDADDELLDVPRDAGTSGSFAAA